MNKYRAWWIKEKEMHNVTILDFKHELVHLLAADTVPLKEIILMQSTGLKDKNGVEIFEGEGIEGEYPNGKYFKGIVEYSVDRAAFVVKTTDSWCPTPLSICKDCVVIGDIYQNPDLLK